MAKKAKKAPAAKQGSKGAVSKRVVITKQISGSKQVKATQSKAKASAAKGAVKASSKARGLQFSAAQWKAYDGAYASAEKSGHAALTAQLTSQARLRALAQRRQAIAAGAQVLRNSRLTAAYSLQKKAAAAQGAASAAAIAANAVRQSYRQSRLAHQNLALEHRIEDDMIRHLQILGRLQFAAKGEKAYAHEAVMRTLTTPEATTIETARFAHAVKTAKKAAATVAPKTKNQALSAQLASQNRAADAVINANAKAAGIAAARAIPAPRAAPKGRSVPRGTKAGWFGNPDGEDCTAAAVLNAVLLSLRQQGASDLGVADGGFRKACGKHPTVPRALDTAMGRWPLIEGYQPTALWRVPGTVIGFETELGAHTALVLSAGDAVQVVSWGEVLNLEDAATGPVEEAYQVNWRAVG